MMSAPGKNKAFSFGMVCTAAVLLLSCFFVVPSESRRSLTSIRKWFKVACIAEHLKETDHYICDKHGYIHCLPGWSNEFEDCKVPVCSQNCSDHGNCTKPNTCTCDVGWTGADCSKCVCLPGCVNGYCQLPFECLCDEGWEGMLCDKPKCKEGCDHGYCTMPGECICHPGWTGENCDVCIKLPGCSKFGYCDKPLECKCREGWEGNFCHVPKCREGCHPQYGFCDRPNECWCRPGWTGPNCTTCLPYPGCQNGGCEQPWECNCSPGWRGKLCNIEGDETTTVFPHSPKQGSGFVVHGKFPEELVQATGESHGDFFDLSHDGWGTIKHKRQNSEIAQDQETVAEFVPQQSSIIVEQDEPTDLQQQLSTAADTTQQMAAAASTDAPSTSTTRGLAVEVPAASVLEDEYFRSPPVINVDDVPINESL